MGKRSRNRRRAEGYYKLPRESRAAHALRNTNVVIGVCHECGHIGALEVRSRLCWKPGCVRRRLKRILEALEAADKAAEDEAVPDDDHAGSETVAA